MELLVVIGIIALLISILLPVLGRARAQANDVLCESNIRQVALALMIYSQSYNGNLPPAEFPVNVGTPWQVQVWQGVMHTPFSETDPTGGGVYAYLAHTPFECPTAALSKYVSPISPTAPPATPPNTDGYDYTDHRHNGYALNIELWGSLGEKSWNITPFIENLQIAESKKLTAVKCPADALLLADSKAFFIEYFDRGSSLNSMDAGFSDGGGMHAAFGRHGKFHDAWNLGYYDGSVRNLRFADVPAVPFGYYNVGARLNPRQFVSAPDIPSASKRFWAGQDH